VQIREYTWLGVDDIRQCLGKSSSALKQTKIDLRSSRFGEVRDIGPGPDLL
jgi:hypothetical protein